jgi:hypothetical protein
MISMIVLSIDVFITCGQDRSSSQLEVKDYLQWTSPK